MRIVTLEGRQQQRRNSKNEIVMDEILFSEQKRGFLPAMDEGISSIVEVEECEDVTVESKNELASVLEECVENEFVSECVENAAVGDGIEARLKMLTQVRDRLAVELKGELVTDFPIKECKVRCALGVVCA